jgi:hypothetical protein
MRSVRCKGPRDQLQSNILVKILAPSLQGYARAAEEVLWAFLILNILLEEPPHAPYKFPSLRQRTIP